MLQSSLIFKKMSQQGAALQNKNNELVKCLEELRFLRENIDAKIAFDEQEKSRLENEISRLTAQLSIVNQNLAKNMTTKQELDKVIENTYATYNKILESSKTLVNVLKKETANFNNKLSSKESSRNDTSNISFRK